MSLDECSHRRRNLLTGDWVLVSPQRTQRPWQGQVEPGEDGELPAYDPGCYLCPGNARAGGLRNPSYTGPFAFDNDYPALGTHGGAIDTGHPLMQAEVESGVCRVVCFSERHDLCLADMRVEQAREVLAFLAAQWSELDRRADIGYVQVFENRGTMMGCSNPHPHAQIWATAGLPNEPARELREQRAYFERHGKAMLLDYLEAELLAGTRIVHVNDNAVSLVPFWAVWPYETLVLPRRAVSGFDALDAADIAGLAEAIHSTLQACSALFRTRVPYSMGFHARPADGGTHPEWQLHAHIYPPLLRSATVRKHMVGFEMLAMPQRDITPEAAAARLRAAMPGSGRDHGSAA